jgi:hypothetical protein
VVDAGKGQPGSRVLVVVGDTPSPSQKEYDMSEKLEWSKATASNGGAGCVELADRGIALRDSKNPDGPSLTFSRPELAAFFDGVRGCEFDHLIEAVG